MLLFHRRRLRRPGDEKFLGNFLFYLLVEEYLLSCFRFPQHRQAFLPLSKNSTTVWYVHFYVFHNTGRRCCHHQKEYHRAVGIYRWERHGPNRVSLPQAVSSTAVARRNDTFLWEVETPGLPRSVFIGYPVCRCRVRVGFLDLGMHSR